MIQDVLPSQITKATKDFDRILRFTANWADWEQQADHAYVIVQEEKFYPIAQIIMMSAGTSSTDFDETEARQYLARKGFRTVLQADEKEKIAARPRPPVRATRKKVKS